MCPPLIMHSSLSVIGRTRVCAPTVQSVNNKTQYQIAIVHNGIGKRLGSGCCRGGPMCPPFIKHVRPVGWDIHVV
jgi:hypothetical protein